MEVKEASAIYAGLTASQGDVTPVGYKRTEVGVVPTDWVVVQAGELHPFVTSGSRGWAMFYSDTGAPFIRITNLARDCIYPDLQDLRFVKLDAGAREGMRTQLQTGDVLISITADIGIVGYVSVVVPKPSYINQHIALMRFDGSRICSKYVSYFWAAENSQRAFRAMTDSGAKAGMNLTTVKQILLAAPPSKVEQEAIAEALSDADALIESLEQLIAKKRQIKQGTMQALLTGRQRLPGFEDEWQVRHLGDVAETDPENLSSNTKADFTFNYIALEDVERGVLRSHSEQRFASSPSRARRKLQVDDVLVSTVRPNLQSHLLFSEANGNWICSTGYCVVRCQKNVTHPGYVFFHFFANLVNRQIEALLSGSNYPAINSGDVRAIEIPVPKLDEQAAIATILTDMDTELTDLGTRLTKTRQLKHGMMQELLTGRIRLV